MVRRSVRKSPLDPEEAGAAREREFPRRKRVSSKAVSLNREKRFAVTARRKRSAHLPADEVTPAAREIADAIAAEECARR